MFNSKGNKHNHSLSNAESLPQWPRLTWREESPNGRPQSFVLPQRNGHKEDILCVAHCPPALLATGSYDGEIIVWNVVSGCIVCRFISPPPEEEQRTGGGDTLKLTS